jgi:NAD(P)-dependent dehydrogenase (short-subunit alcohol dehydrogenase family)
MPKTPDYFKAKTIVITGAASGIGRATARIFGREGANVVCADVNEQGANQAAREVEAAGGHARAIFADVTRRESVRQMIAAAVETYGQVHFLFNSAGSAIRRAKFLEVDDDLWDRTYDLNVKGTFYAMQEVIPHMLDREFGVIVNVASVAARNGGPGKSPHYASAKGAVNTLTMGAAREFADRNIRITSVSPAIVDTAFQDINEPGMFEAAVANVPMGRAGRAEEIGELVLFLCSDACEFLIAETVPVTGGGGFR